jgi:hypothetical protein
MRNEMAFMAGLKFHLTLHHPYKALRGLLADCKVKRGIHLTTQPGAALQMAPGTCNVDTDKHWVHILLSDWRAFACRARLFVMHSLVSGAQAKRSPAAPSSPKDVQVK